MSEASAGAPQGELDLALEIDSPLDMPRWRPLAHWAMAFPLYIFAIAPIILGIFAWIVAWFAILFTGRMPVMMHNLITLWIRFHYRLIAFVFGLTIAYPPLTFSPGGPDDGDHNGVTITMPGLRGETSRLALIHSIMAIPHAIVLFFLGFAFLGAGAVAWFAVLITGKYPAALHGFMINVLFWQLRVQAYVGMLYEQYPRFGFGNP